MQSPCINACRTITNFIHQHHHGLYPCSSSSSSFPQARKFNPYLSISCNFDSGSNRKLNGNWNTTDNKERAKIITPQARGGGKENVWSVDNKMAEAEEKDKEKLRRRKKKRGGGGLKKNWGKKNNNSTCMVSGAMLMEVETVLQTQVYICSANY